MILSFINPASEAPALRRAAQLLERVRQDAPGLDPRIEELEAGVGALQRAAAAGRTVHTSALKRLQAVLAEATPVAQPPAGSLSEELVRWNAFAELRELFRRLAYTAPLLPPLARSPELSRR